MEIKHKKIYRKNHNVIIYDKNRIEDIITCPICLEKYKHPRNLNCGHPFCTTCLHLITINNQITCPICRYITKFNGLNLLTDLPINSSLISIIDEMFLDTNKKNLKRSKSVDSFIKFKKNIVQRNVFYNNEIRQNSLNNDEYIIDCKRECCTFQ